MPCRCSGVRYDKCKCRILGSGFQVPNSVNSRVMILAAEKESACCVHSVMRTKRSIFIRVFECVYERCAGYNLRYCPMRGFRSKNCINEALRDLLVMVCFLLANFVVFLTIFARMTMHMSAVLVQSARWFRRLLIAKIVENKNAIMVSTLASQEAHDFSPP